MYNREQNGGENADYLSEQRKPAVHERLLNLETKSMRPFYRKHNGGQANAANSLQLEHIKQNAIRFCCPEHEYNTFLT